jgi:hypothetical protein
MLFPVHDLPVSVCKLSGGGHQTDPAQGLLNLSSNQENGAAFGASGFCYHRP